MAKKKKDLAPEVNLVSFISLLSVLICSLLLTAIWIQIGSIDVKQAVGGQSQAETKKVPSLWAFMKAEGTLVLQLQDAPRVKRGLRKAKITGREGKLDKEALEAHVIELRKAIPNLNTALIQPQAESLYEDVIGLMDHFKAVGVKDLGVAPL